MPTIEIGGVVTEQHRRAGHFVVADGLEVGQALVPGVCRGAPVVGVMGHHAGVGPEVDVEDLAHLRRDRAHPAAGRVAHVLVGPGVGGLDGAQQALRGSPRAETPPLSAIRSRSSSAVLLRVSVVDLGLGHREREPVRPVGRRGSRRGTPTGRKTPR